MDMHLCWISLFCVEGCESDETNSGGIISIKSRLMTTANISLTDAGVSSQQQGFVQLAK